MGGVVKAVGNLFSGGGSPAAPAAPDYTGAAQATASSNKEAATANTWANRPTMNTPWGTQSWDSSKATDPATGQEVTQWTQNTNLNPMAQKALDSQMSMQQGRSDIANSLMPNAQAAITKPIDYSSAQGWGKSYNGPSANTAFTTNALNNSQSMNPNGFIDNSHLVNTNRGLDNSRNMQTSGISGAGMYRPVSDAIYSQATSRLDPQFSQAQSDLDAKLAAQGISRNSNAYNRSQDNFARQRTDAYQTAMNNATTGGISAANTLQGMDINRMNTQNNALMNQQQLNQSSINNQNQAVMNQQQLNSNYLNNSNNAIAQQQGLDINAKNFGNSAITNMNNAQNQNFNQTQTLANYDNTLRQAQIAEQIQAQNNSLNNMNALMSGQQVSMPSMPGFQNATQYGGVNYTGAARDQAQFNQDQANAVNAQNSNTQSGLFGLAGTGMQAASLFGLSDERLKEDIRQVGSIMGGKLGIYKYRFIGSAKEFLGVMAQEVQKHYPDCVYRRQSGYLMVDYGKLLGA